MRFLLYCVLLIAAVSTAEGQTAAIDSFVPSPKGPIVCRSKVPPATDPAAYVFEFLNGDDLEFQQWTIAEFDSAGRPLQLVTWLPNPTSTPPILKMLVVNFPAPTRGELHVIPAVRPDSAGGAVGSPPLDPTQPGMVLTPGQIESARRVAKWFWDHRCTNLP